MIQYDNCENWVLRLPTLPVRFYDAEAMFKIYDQYKYVNILNTIHRLCTVEIFKQRSQLGFTYECTSVDNMLRYSFVRPIVSYLRDAPTGIITRKDICTMYTKIRPNTELINHRFGMSVQKYVASNSYISFYIEIKRWPCIIMTLKKAYIN